LKLRAKPTLISSLWRPTVGTVFSTHCAAATASASCDMHHVLYSRFQSRLIRLCSWA